jgi:hypothetical protein
MCAVARVKPARRANRLRMFPTLVDVSGAFRLGLARQTFATSSSNLAFALSRDTIAVLPKYLHEYV